jgi:hypothetical protein
MITVSLVCASIVSMQSMYTFYFYALHVLWLYCTRSVCALFLTLLTSYFLGFMWFIYMCIPKNTILPGLIFQTCEVFKEYQCFTLGFLFGKAAWVSWLQSRQTLLIIYTLQNSLFTCSSSQCICTGVFHCLTIHPNRYWPQTVCLTSFPLLFLPLSHPTSLKVSVLNYHFIILPLMQFHDLYFVSVMNKIYKINVGIDFYVSK